MNKIVENEIRKLLLEKKCIDELKNTIATIEVSNFLDKNKIISLHKTRLNLTQDLSQKKLFSKLINSLKSYSGERILLVFIKYNSIQETYFIDEDIKSIYVNGRLFNRCIFRTKILYFLLVSCIKTFFDRHDEKKYKFGHVSELVMV